MATLQVLLQDKLTVLLQLDEDILITCTTEEIEGEIAESDTVNSRITETIERCKRAKQAPVASTATPIRRESTPLRIEVCSPSDIDVPENPVDSDDSHVNRASISALKPKLPKYLFRSLKVK